MNVTKRDERTEEFDIEKVHDVLFWATEGIKGVTVSDIEMKVAAQFHDDITTKNIHQILIQGAADMITEQTPNYQQVAANLLNFYLRKERTMSKMEDLVMTMKTHTESSTSEVYVGTFGHFKV